jgi:sialate O-acetylesterase
MLTAARGYKRGGKELADPRSVDVHRVPGWAVDGSSGPEMIAWVEEAARSGSLAVFIFHGVGGGHSINVAREDHRKLLEWLNTNRDRVWTAPFLKVIEHVLAERKAR